MVILHAQHKGAAMIKVGKKAKVKTSITVDPEVLKWAKDQVEFGKSVSSIFQNAIVYYINSHDESGASEELINNAPKAQTNERKAAVKPTAKKKVKVLADRPSSIPVQIWEEYLALRKTKKAILTKTAFAKIVEQGRIAGLDDLETVKTCLSNGWAGFKASWIKEDNKGIINYGTDQRDCKQDQGTRRNGETESQYRDRLSRQISEEFAEIVRADPSERSTPEQF